MEKIIIFGGTFNPIHNAHLEIARVASEKLGGVRVLIMPNGKAPHKETDLDLMEHRVNMVKLAIEDYENFEYFGLEVESGRISYSLDSLKEINKIFKGYDIYSLTGEDFLYTVEDWENSEGLFDLATFIVFSRPENSFATNLTSKNNSPYTKIKELADTKNADIIYLQNVNMDLSASYIRKKFKGNKKDIEEVQSLLPKKVYDYILENDIYKEINYFYLIESIKKDIRVQLSKKRATHTLSVAETARELAVIHGENEDKVYVAALLHDIAKEFSDEKMIALLEENNLPTNKFENINLNHGTASKIISKKVYGIKEKKILRAIENHTFGRVGMTKFEMIVALADFIEPERNFKGRYKESADAIRKLAKTDILGAYLLKLDSLISEFEIRGKAIEPNTINVYNDLIRRIEKDKK